ncbi:PHP domain-containing protein [Marinobacterium aestuariivivens]|uniref:PHP domain-containing protein n=1 Tax=Marinobacterium aestuariivivens TaxID=1698799 RepID=A0ABW1ZWP3_9GAMM
MPLPKYDLHCHTTASDGALAPTELVRRAAGVGVEVLAITDHDTVGGLDEAFDSAAAEGVRLLTGVELTASWGRQVVHLVGLGFDWKAAALQDYLRRLDALRFERAQRIAQKLQQRNLPDLLPAVLERSAGGQVGRPHFAAALVAANVCESEQQAFKRYLGPGKIGDVKMPWPTMKEALELLHQTGGVSVLAHPTKYRLTFTRLRTLLSEFADAGGVAVEVSYSGVKPEHQRELQKVARQLKLRLSAGSDFHRPEQVWVELGRFMPLASDEGHVLELLL